MLVAGESDVLESCGAYELEILGQRFDFWLFRYMRLLVVETSLARSIILLTRDHKLVVECGFRGVDYAFVCQLRWQHVRHEK